MTKADDVWPHTTRALPWALAGFLTMVWLVPFDSISLPVSLPLDTFDGIASLVDQSLLRRTADGAESRFGMLETIREYGRDRLAVPDRNAPRRG